MNTIKRLGEQRGSMLLEAALVTPLMIMILAGIIQFGFILNAKVAVNAASYEAARAATLSRDPRKKAYEAAADYASSTLPGWSFDERLLVDVDLSGNDPYDLVGVSVSYYVPLFFGKVLPISSGTPSGSFRVTGTSVMRIEEKS